MRYRVRPVHRAVQERVGDQQSDEREDERYEPPGLGLALLRGPTATVMGNHGLGVLGGSVPVLRTWATCEASLWTLEQFGQQLQPTGCLM